MSDKTVQDTLKKLDIKICALDAKIDCKDRIIDMFRNEAANPQ
jgi:hypothetical protein